MLSYVLSAAFLLGPGLETENPASAELNELTVTAPEPRFVAPTRRDRIGRIWAPVQINGKGPFRLVLDTGYYETYNQPHVQLVNVRKAPIAPAY